MKKTNEIIDQKVPGNRDFFWLCLRQKEATDSTDLHRKYIACGNWVATKGTKRHEEYIACGNKGATDNTDLHG